MINIDLKTIEIVPLGNSGGGEGGGVEIKNQSKSIQITENGTQDITYDNGYTGLEQVTITTNIDIPTFTTQTKVVEITENGTQDITVDEGYDGMDKVTITTNIQSSSSGGGGNPFEEIGYTSTPQYIQDGIDYSKEIYDSWNASVTNRSRAFSGNTELIYFPLVNTSNVVYMLGMFNSCTNLKYVPELDTSNVTTMSQMFYNCESLTSLDVSNWDTSNVTDMSQMFYYCGSLTSLDASNWNTSNVISMSSMFYNCKSLTSLDVSNWNTSKVTNTTSMFTYCSNLTEIHWKNFGNGSGYKSVSFTSSSKLGVNTTNYPNAKQSLIDTLITYSFDRATAGYSTCTIQLHSKTKELLTDDEIAAITAKGFTIA